MSKDVMHRNRKSAFDVYGAERAHLKAVGQAVFNFTVIEDF